MLYSHLKVISHLDVGFEGDVYVSSKVINKISQIKLVVHLIIWGILHHLTRLQIDVV